MLLENWDDHPKQEQQLWSLHEMERTGGDPDVMGQDKKTGEVIFFDSSEQSPKGRASARFSTHASGT